MARRRLARLGKMKSPQPTRGERRGGTWHDEQGERRGVGAGTAGGGIGGDLPAVRGSFEGVVFRVAEEEMGNLFKRRELMHIVACKEFYANLTVFIYKKKEIAKSRVKGVEIEFDSMKMASILDVPGHTGISEYIKEVWEESKYIKPLEITRKFANNSSINVERRVQSTEMKPFQRFVHFIMMKIMVPRFGKRDTTSFMDLTYMDHLVSGRKINLPRVMMRHMAYVISVKDHELPYGDWMTMVFEAFGVPLVDKKGEEPKRYAYFEETFLTMCKLRREDGVWWIGSGENRRRYDVVDAPEEEDEEEEEGNQTEFDWEAVIDEATVEGKSRSDEQFYVAQVDVEEPVIETPAALEVVAQASVQQKETAASGVDPSCPTDRIPDAVMNKLQAEFERARANRFQADLEKAQTENARLLALLQQAQTEPKP
ncbi:hypothetical protein Dimus_022980 [Dionaea muscipula]